jgi:exopolyphosphatase/guanosine-5'-triphosphate,3'-diphosphate pyrophosphatase
MRTRIGMATRPRERPRTAAGDPGPASRDVAAAGDRGNGSASPSTATRIAAIDIGSNSIRQIIADVSAGGVIRVVDDMKAAPRLGAGVERSGELAADAIDRAVDSLVRMATLARQMGAERIEAVATSAVRDAANASAFLGRVKREAKLDIRVLDGTDEARLCFRSALAHFDLGRGRTVVMDIGGGSLELALSAEGVVEHLASLPLGAIRMTELFVGDPISRKDVKALRSAAREMIRREIRARDWRGAQVIGSGGTFTNLAGIHLSRHGVAMARSRHGTVIPREELEHVLDMLVSMTADERRTVPGLNPERADIIMAGLAVAAEVMARVDAREVLVSRYGIREGLLLETARVTPTIADPGEARDRSVREFAERCHYEPLHAQTVQRLALQLFDALGPRLGCATEDRPLLADAALLHDIGYHISYERHHKHSYHLILHAELLGMSPTEQVIVANVARYHRGGRPRAKHRNFGSLDRPLRRRIKRLAAILRVADGFDRGHVGAVGEVKVRRLRRAIRLTPVPVHRSAPIRLEVWGAQRKSALLADVAGVPIEIVAPDGSVLSSDDVEGSAEE